MSLELHDEFGEDPDSGGAPCSAGQKEGACRRIPRCARNRARCGRLLNIAREDAQSVPDAAPCCSRRLWSGERVLIGTRKCFRSKPALRRHTGREWRTYSALRASCHSLLSHPQESAKQRGKACKNQAASADHGFEPKRLLVTIRDYGDWYSVHATGRLENSGLGLVAMQERAESRRANSG